jgi:hypothetical protein
MRPGDMHLEYGWVDRTGRFTPQPFSDPGADPATSSSYPAGDPEWLEDVVHDDLTYVLTSLAPEEFLRQERKFNAAFSLPPELPAAPPPAKRSRWRRFLGGG